MKIKHITINAFECQDYAVLNCAVDSQKLISIKNSGVNKELSNYYSNIPQQYIDFLLSGIKAVEERSKEARLLYFLQKNKLITDFKVEGSPLSFSNKITFDYTHRALVLIAAIEKKKREVCNCWHLYREV